MDASNSSKKPLIKKHSDKKRPSGFRNSEEVKKETWWLQLEQLKEGLDLMQREAESIPAKHGMTKEGLEALLANPSQFSPTDWQLIEEARRKSERLKEELAAILQSPAAAKEAREKERRKPKAKKHWIPLQ